MSHANSSNNPNFFSRNYALSWLIVLILSGSCIYLFVSRKRSAADNDTALQKQQYVIDSINTDKLYLQSNFDAASARIDQLMSKNAGLQDSLKDQKTAIAGLQSKIRTILSSQAATRDQLLEASILIYMLNKKAQAYELYIAELEKDNAILNGKNELLTEERDNTVQKNIELQMAGSVLHASNIRLEVIHERRNGKEKETSRAKKADRMRITFDIDENHVAETGTKQVYIRITRPDGTVVRSASASGTITTIKGEEIKFSLLKEVDLVKNDPLKNVIVEWPQKDSYIKGTYTVELYNGGYKIGGQSIALK